MAHSAVTLWKSCLKALQQLTADPSNKAAVESAVCNLFELLDDADRVKDLPHATVKKLVNELQVGMAFRLMFSLLRTKAHAKMCAILNQLWVWLWGPFQFDLQFTEDQSSRI